MFDADCVNIQYRCGPDKLKVDAMRGGSVSCGNGERLVRKMAWVRTIAVATIVLGTWSCHARAQAAAPKAEPRIVQQAATLQIPLSAINRETMAPISNLTESDFALSIDGQPRTFQLSRPWTATAHPPVGQPQDQLNLLIILPLGVPLDREQVIEKTMAELSQQPERGWNISILDDAGSQTPYTRGLKTAIAGLKEMEDEAPAEVNLAAWRTTAALAIASMRDLPGRRVVLTLGNIFHEVVVQDGEVVYEAFQVDDVATAARNAGATIYAAGSLGELEQLRRLAPHYVVIGAGPWLLSKDGQVAGWISNSVADTIEEIRRNGAGAYQIDLHLESKELDGQIHAISITAHRPDAILSVPAYYIAPSLARLQQLGSLPAALREALKIPPPEGSSPLEMTTQLAYFPHRDGKTGTQIATTGFFWNQSTEPPKELRTVLRLEQAGSGYVLNTTIGRLDWSTSVPVWNTALEVGPGAYRIRVAAVDESGKIAAAIDTPFTVEPTTDDAVRISSVVIGRNCVFVPEPTDASGAASVMVSDRARECQPR